MATAFPPDLLQLFDDYGDVLALGKVYSYEAGSETPLATYTDLAGATPNANPVELDAAGRATIRCTIGTAYKFIVKDESGSTIWTRDNVTVGDAAAAASTQYEVLLTYCETPGAQGWMGGVEFKRSVTFPVDFDGSGGSVVTSPGSSYVIGVKKNGSACGTITIATDGVFTFASTGGSTVSFISGDTMDFYGPDSVGTAANFKITLVGSL